MINKKIIKQLVNDLYKNTSILKNVKIQVTKFWIRIRILTFRNFKKICQFWLLSKVMLCNFSDFWEHYSQGKKMKMKNHLLLHFESNMVHWRQKIWENEYLVDLYKLLNFHEDSTLRQFPFK